jgi:hypothetical protein
LGSENQRTNDTPNTSCSHNGGRAESTLPLAQNIIRLIGKGKGDVRESWTNDEECTEISDTTWFGKSKYADAQNLEAAIEKKEWSSQIPLIGEIALSHTENDGEDIALM